MHESNIAESVMPGRLVAGPWILNPGRRTFESGLLSRLGSQFFDNLKFPLRPMAGRCALNAEIVVQVHGGSRSYGLSAGWLTVYQQGRVQFPLAPP